MKAFIIVRDRAVYARRCMHALLVAGLEVVIVDQGSTWPDAVAWLEHLERMHVTVLRRGGGHPRGIWDWAPFREARGDERYIVTDPDVLPAEHCPLDWPERLSWVLDEFPSAPKAGLGLRTDNIPDWYGRRDQVISWERQFWQHMVADGVWQAGIDTTLALYREGSGFAIEGALRTGFPYTADHLAWHENLDYLTEETRYYYEHAEPGITHWAARGHSNWGNLQEPADADAVREADGVRGQPQPGGSAEDDGRTRACGG